MGEPAGGPAGALQVPLLPGPAQSSGGGHGPDHYDSDTDQRSPLSPVGYREDDDGASSHRFGRWWPVRDPDRFYRQVYEYYAAKGFHNTICRGVLKHVTVLVVAFVLLVVFQAIDYHQLYRRLEDAPCPNRSRRTTLFESDCHGNHPISLARLADLPWGVNILLLVFVLVWAWFFVVFLRTIPSTAAIRDFYVEELKISHEQLQTIRWDRVMDALIETEARVRIIQTDRTLDKLAITHLITRRVNYTIALYHLGVLDSALKVNICWTGRRIFVTRLLKQFIDLVLDANVFDKNCIHHRVLSADPSEVDTVAREMAKQFRLLGFCAFGLMPVLLIARVAIFCFDHIDELQKSPAPLATRTWSPYARVLLRGYCEVEHKFSDRLHRGRKPALRYVQLFSSEFVAIWARFLSFTIGGFLGIILLLSAIYDEEFLEEELTPHRSVTWWLGLLGVVLAILHSFLPGENAHFDRAEELAETASLTHYFPSRWRGREDDIQVFDEFSRLFQHKGLSLVEELIGIIYVIPWMLVFRLPASSSKIVQFIRECTTDVDGIGHVCRFAELQDTGKRDVLDVENSVTASIDAADGKPGEASILPREIRSKMEWSMLGFQGEHADWVPDQPGVALIESAVDFGTKDSSIRRRETKFG